MKLCHCCGQSKSLDHFYSDKSKSDGLYSTCKECKKDRVKIEWSRNYNETHKEQRTAYQFGRRKLLNILHPGRATQRQREFRNLHPGRAAADIARRKARKLNAPGAGISADEWNELQEEYGHRCAYCGKVKTLTLDHVIPLIRGGAHEKENAVPACGHCNSSKGAKPLLVWMHQTVAFPGIEIERIQS